MRTRLPITIVFLLVLSVLAGCIGQTQQSTGQSSSEAEDSPEDEKDSSEPQVNTTTTSAIVPINVAGPTGTLIGAGDMTLLSQPPVNYSGILLEFVWTTPTKEVDAGDLTVDVDDEGTFSNTTMSADGPATMRIHSGEYTSEDLHAWAHPRRGTPPNAWVAANVTAYVTVFSGGPPNWDFSATT